MAVVNACHLERNLYLVAELLALPVPVVVGLNMMDVAEAQGCVWSPRCWRPRWALPVVELVASKRPGWTS